MKKSIVLLLSIGLMLTSCSKENAQITESYSLTENTSVIAETGVESTTVAVEDRITETVPTTMEELVLTIDGMQIPVSWEENESVDALKELCQSKPVTIEMSMYGGFEQVGPLGQALPRDDEHIKTHYGDIVLYSGDQIVLFYGSNTWSYTRLGKMMLSEEELVSILSNGDVIITIELQQGGNQNE